MSVRRDNERLRAEREKLRQRVEDLKKSRDRALGAEERIRKRALVLERDRDGLVELVKMLGRVLRGWEAEASELHVIVAAEKVVSDLGERIEDLAAFGVKGHDEAMEALKAFEGRDE